MKYFNDLIKSINFTHDINSFIFQPVESFGQRLKKLRFHQELRGIKCLVKRIEKTLACYKLERACAISGPFWDLKYFADGYESNDN